MIKNIIKINGSDNLPEEPEEELLPRLLAGTLLGDILRVHMQLNDTCDKKANITLGISGIILVIMLTKVVDIFKPNSDYDIILKIGFILTVLASIISAILSIYVIYPRKIEDKSRLNLFYFGSFTNISKDEYVSEIKNLLNDRERIATQYAEEIYDLGQSDLMPRFKTLNLASRVLVWGLIFGTLTILIYLHPLELLNRIIGSII